MGIAYHLPEIKFDEFVKSHFNAWIPAVVYPEIDAGRVWRILYLLSFNDCFAVSNARRENAIIVTGDPDFKNVEHIVEIEWLDK